jgi:long-chain acyl-CoA synthetase
VRRVSRVLDAIRHAAAASPGATALSSPAGAWTYPELAAAIDAAAERLRTLAPPGSHGAPVAVMLENSPAWVILDLALLQLGWPSLPVPQFFTPEQRRHALEDAGAGLLIEADRWGPFQVGGATLRVTELPAPGAMLPPHTAKITYTSGSTGRPKGVCLSLDQMEAVAASLVQVIGEDYAGRHLPILPLAILLENVAGLYTTLLAGGCYHVLPPQDLGLADPFRPDLSKLAAAIAGEGATSLILVPELLRALMMVMGFTGVTFPGLRLVAVGGAKVSTQLLDRAAELGLPVFEGYGLSECASVVALNTPGDNRRGAVGRPLPHLSVTIEDGEIVVGPRPFLGYAGSPPSEGPVRTGDLGRLDADGFLYILGRRTNTIITAFGRNVAPEWVESELLAQPEIRQAVVFGEAQADLGALIVPIAPGLEPAAIASAIARANQNLPEYARVRRWTVRAPFDPARGEVTGNGRPRRAVILAAHRDFTEVSE